MRERETEKTIKRSKEIERERWYIRFTMNNLVLERERERERWGERGERDRERKKEG